MNRNLLAVALFFSATAYCLASGGQPPEPRPPEVAKEDGVKYFDAKGLAAIFTISKGEEASLDEVKNFKRDALATMKMYSANLKMRDQWVSLSRSRLKSIISHLTALADKNLDSLETEQTLEAAQAHVKQAVLLRAKLRELQSLEETFFSSQYEHVNDRPRNWADQIH